jgi:hypothetical protein
MLIKRIFKSNIMLYNIKVVHLHCVFHGIRFKVNEDWVSVIDTLLFFCIKSKLFLYLWRYE